MQKSSTLNNNWLLFLSLYTTQNIGLGFMMIALIGILRSRGADLADLSVVYLLGIPWILKFLWAPLIDCFGYKKWGHYRSWLLILQALMVVLLLCLSQLSLDTQFHLIMLGGIIFVTCSASQDIAVDALASLEFNHQQRGLANGIQMAGGMLGNLVGGGLVLILYDHIGWQGAFFLMATITAISWLQVFRFRETKKLVVERQLSLGKTFKHFFGFWRGKQAWLLFLIVVTAANPLVYANLTPMILDAGKTLADVGMILNVLGMAIGVVTGLMAGWLIHYLGRKRALQYFSCIQFVGFIVIIVVALLNTDFMLYLACTICLLLRPLVIAILTTLMMDYAAQNNTPGTDYSLQFALVMFMSILMGSIGLQIAQHFDYFSVFSCAVGISGIALILAFRYAKKLPEHASSTTGYLQNK